MEKEEEETRWRRGSSYRSLGSSRIIGREGPDMLRSSNMTLKLSPDKLIRNISNAISQPSNNLMKSVRWQLQ